MTTVDRAAEPSAEPLDGPESVAGVRAGPVTPLGDEQGAESRTAPRNAAARRGKANSDRGKRAERALVAWLREHGWPGAERTVRTGHRAHGRVSADRGDVDGTLGLAWQLKDVADAALHKIPTWLSDTDAQRVAAGADVGVLVIKRRGHADVGEWWAHVPLGALVPDAALPGDIAAVPVRLAVADVALILRRQGYGSPLTDGAEA